MTPSLLSRNGLTGVGSRPTLRLTVGTVARVESKFQFRLGSGLALPFFRSRNPDRDYFPSNLPGSFGVHPYKKDYHHRLRVNAELMPEAEGREAINKVSSSGVPLLCAFLPESGKGDGGGLPTGLSSVVTNNLVMSIDSKHSYRFGLLKSEEWKGNRKIVLAQRKAKCEVCKCESWSKPGYKAKKPTK